MKRAGFTLVEILTAVVIVTILTAMAVPLYEKTVERSRLAEVRTILDRLQASKWAAMDNMGYRHYNTAIEMKHLNVAFSDDVSGHTFSTKAFNYSLLPTGSVSGIGTIGDAVCARRRNGEYAGTLFLFYGENGEADPQFLCYDGSTGDCGGACCQVYGLSSTAFGCDGV